MCMIESLTMGPREGRLSLNKFGSIYNVPFMHYWKRSAQNPSGLTPEDIDQEIQWQKAVYDDTNAEEGSVVPQLVHSSKGRFFDLGFLHTVSKWQFKSTSIVPGANVTMLEKLLNDERRDRQVEMDEMMLQGTRGMIRALGQNPAFRQCVENRSPISMPGGSSISTAPPESYQFPAASPPTGFPFDGSTTRDPNQPPEVMPWPGTCPPLPEGPPPSLSGERTQSPPPLPSGERPLSPPPPPPPLSSAPAVTHGQ